MTRTTVTLEQARDRLLFPALDAISLNSRQQRLLINTQTPEVDSAVEWIASLGQAPYNLPGEEIRAGLLFLQQLIELNRAEGDHARTVAETADRLAREAEDAADQGRRVRDLARELRPHLRVMQQRSIAQDPIGYRRAYRSVLRAIDGVPVEKLLCTFMETELRQGSFGLLSRIVEEAREQEAVS